MAKRKSRLKCLLLSSGSNMDFLHSILKDIINTLNADIQFDLFAQFDRKQILRNRQENKDFIGSISSSDLILVDLEHILPATFFEIGIARAIGKPIVFIAESVFIDDFPDFIRQNYIVLYRHKDELYNKLRDFFLEYTENPKRFTPRRLIGPDTGSHIVVDLEKLDQRDFENLSFELLSQLGYKQLEWKIKDGIVDAVSTLRKQDPDGFGYDEFWLIAFEKEYVNREMLDMALHEPRYFLDRIFDNILEPSLLSKGRMVQSRVDVPITLLFILRGKDNYPKKIIKDISRRNYSMNRSGHPSIRIRWWDDQIITSLVQNNSQLTRKYFSSDALTKSGVRLSYEELYKENIGMYEELQKTNEALIAERNRIELLERDAAWKLLSFTAAHRLGNPMDAIDSELSNLKLAISLNKSQDVIDEIIKSMEIPVEKAKSIIAQFRNLSIAHEINPEITKSNKLSEILNYATKQAIAKKVKVKFDLKSVPDISIDSQKLLECFEELIRNSLHFIKGEHQHISISTSLSKDSDLPDKIDRTRKYIKITFEDNGCGVPHEKKKDIFKPFERGYIHGTGLGLAFCEIIIEKHGGKIREIGNPSEGALFEIFLPVIDKT